MRSPLGMLILVAGIAFSQSNQKATPAPPTTVPTGRYQIVFSPHARADTYLLDTETGRVWQFTKFPYLNGEPSAWMSVARIDTPSQRDAFQKEHGVKPTESADAAPTLPPSLAAKAKLKSPGSVLADACSKGAPSEDMVACRRFLGEVRSFLMKDDPQLICAPSEAISVQAAESVGISLKKTSHADDAFLAASFALIDLFECPDRKP